jgi:hypothetical protein
MKEIKENITEEAILMYKENVSPSRKNLEMILSQIPEQKIRFNNLNEIQGKTRVFSEVYKSYSEEKTSSFDAEVRQIIKPEEARAIRSPYIWIAITEMVTLCSIMFALYPTLRIEMVDAQINQEFNIIDSQNDDFQLYMDTTDFDEPTI